MPKITNKMITEREQRSLDRAGDVARAIKKLPKPIYPCARPYTDKIDKLMQRLLLMRHSYISAFAEEPGLYAEDLETLLQTTADEIIALDHDEEA